MVSAKPSTLSLIVVLSIIGLVTLNTASATTYPLTFEKLTVSDPVGDDKGPGYYGYPSNPVFKQGVFDIVRFTISENASYLVIRVYLRDLGGNPFNGPNGFSLQNIQVYIRDASISSPGREDTFGLNIVLRSDYAWHYALILTPGWGSKPYPSGGRSVLYYSNGSTVAQNNYTFKVFTNNDSNAVVAVLSRKLIPHPQNLLNWRVVVAVTEYNKGTLMKVGDVSVRGSEFSINATAFAGEEERMRICRAVSEGVEPKVLDIALYSATFPKGIGVLRQYFWLNNYNASLKTLASIPPCPALTITKTVIQTLTYHHTTTQTHIIHHTHTVTMAKHFSESFILGVIGMSLISIFAGLALIYVASKKK